WRTTRRVRGSQERKRPSKSKVFPLLLLDAALNTLMCPSSSTRRIWRLLGISLHTKYRPPLFPAQPSAQSAPVQSRSTAVLPILYFANRLSRTTIAESG